MQQQRRTGRALRQALRAQKWSQRIGRQGGQSAVPQLRGASLVEVRPYGPTAN